LDKKDTDMKKFKEHLDIIGKFYMCPYMHNRCIYIFPISNIFLILGIFGRLIPHYTLPLLTQLIEDRTSKLREIFNKLVEQIESLHTMKNDSLSRLYKDIHWLILIMSDVICLNTVSQLPLIPDEIIKYDIEQVCR
jgi:hypothetical protein